MRLVPEYYILGMCQCQPDAIVSELKSSVLLDQTLYLKAQLGSTIWLDEISMSCHHGCKRNERDRCGPHDGVEYVPGGCVPMKVIDSGANQEPDGLFYTLPRGLHCCVLYLSSGESNRSWCTMCPCLERLGIQGTDIEANRNPINSRALLTITFSNRFRCFPRCDQHRDYQLRRGVNWLQQGGLYVLF